MGRPLRAKYANTTYVNGVQEMSNTDISSVIVPLISQHLVDNYSNPASVGLGQTLTIQLGQPAWGSNVVSSGNITDIKAVTAWGAPVAIGDHPVTNTSSFGVSLWQNLNTADPFTAPADLGANRPLQTVSSGGVRRIQSMTDTEIENDIISNVVSTMVTGGLGAYWLGTTAPVDGGTWVVRSSVLYDTYSGPSGEITTNYYLWQKTATGSSVGTIRPLKRTANNQLQEMSNTDIVNLASHIRKYTVNTGIGLYAISTSAPGTGTWISRGSFVDTRNVLTDDSYSGSYLGIFSAGFTGQYTGAFSGSYQGGYTGAFTGIYAGSYLSAFTGDYVGTFTGQFTGGYTRAFSGNYTGTYNANYAGSYTGSWANSFARLFTGVYTSSVYTSIFTNVFSGTYRNPFNSVFYSGTYSDFYITSYLSGGLNYGSFTGSPATWTATFTGVYSGTYVNPFNSVTYAGAWVGSYRTAFIQNSFVGSYQGSFSTLFTGTWTGLFAGSRQNTFGGSYNQTFVGVYNNTFSKPFTGIYSRLFTGTYSGIYNQSFTGAYVGTYNQAFSGSYGNSFSRLFTGAYSGLTVSSSTVTTTYTLWVRTA